MTNNISLADVRNELRQIEARAKLLREIESELVATEKKWEAYRQGMVQKLASESPMAPSAPPSLIGGYRRQPRKNLTKKQMIVEAMNPPTPLWQTANEVQALVSQMSGKEVPMSSISPALSELKNAGTVVRQGMVVALALRVESEEPGFFKENEPPEGGSETGEPGSSPIETQKREGVFE